MPLSLLAYDCKHSIQYSNSFEMPKKPRTAWLFRMSGEVLVPDFILHDFRPYFWTGILDAAFPITAIPKLLDMFYKNISEEQQILEQDVVSGPDYWAAGVIGPGRKESQPTHAEPQPGFPPDYPNVEGAGNPNSFLKSLKVLGELAVGIKEGFWDDNVERADKMINEWKNPSLSAVLPTFDFLTLGIVSGFWSGHKNRVERSMKSKWTVHDENGNFSLKQNHIYNFINTVLIGLPDRVSGAFFPEEKISAQHWADMIGTGFLATSVANKVAKARLKAELAKTKFPKQGAGKGFKSQQLFDDHYVKHGSEIQKSLGESSYSSTQYLNDANHVIQNGTYVPELNGYVRFMGGQKYGFVGLDRATGDITTFHIKTVSELIKNAPSLELGK